MWFNGCVTGTSQSDSLLTIGEAAEQAGIALLELREHIRSGRLATVRGQRLGDELPLISLHALVYLYPSAARRRRRPLGTLAERGIAVLGQKSGLEPKLGTGLPPGAERRRPQAAPEAPQATPGLDAKPGKQAGLGQAGPDDSPAPDLDLGVEKLEQEIARLREEVSAARDQNQSLLIDIDSASEEAQRVLDGAKGPALHRRKNRDRSRREQAELDSALDGVGAGRSNMGWFVALAGLVVAAMLIGWLRNPVHAASIAPEPPALDPDHQRESIVVRTLRDGAALERNLAAQRRARARKINQELVDPAAAKVAAAGAPSLGDGQGEVPAGAEPEAPATDGPQGPADALLPALVSTGEACEMYPLAGVGQPLRDVLGPCLGAWNPAEKGVVGVHRQDGKHWCLHHTVMARDLGGSIVRAKEIAEFAIKDGLVPPLLQLRVDRAAAGFLEARTGTWIESGFESGSGSDHRVSRLASRDRWKVESWVRVPAEGGAVRRSFRMQVELNGSEWLDRELEFEWQD